MKIIKLKIPGQNEVIEINDSRIPGIDISPVSGSVNLITSGGVYDIIGNTKISCNTTAYWNIHSSYVPQKGELIVYLDASSYEKSGETIYVPGIKIGNNTASVGSLPFLGETTRIQLFQHINDASTHITNTERTKWNRKLGIKDDAVVIDENLILYRD